MRRTSEVSETAGQGHDLKRWRRKVKRRYVVLLLLLALALIFRHPLAINGKVLLLISEEFPQIPVKPLHLVTRAPDHRRLVLSSPHGPIVADLFLPRPWIGASGSKPAIILAFGVKIPRSAKRDVLHLADTLARLGYVTLWPRLRVLDQGQARLEEATTFLGAFAYLETLQAVDRDRISYFGISVGASTAFVAASDSRIARSVHSLVFFGGYFDIADYLVSLAAGRDRFEKREVPWQPTRDALKQLKAILKNERAWSVLRVFHARTSSQARRILAASNQLTALRRFSPSDHLHGFKARIFILHDKGDQYVPYVESEKLYRALPGSVPKTILLTSLFRHVEPGGSSLGQLVQLYGFVYRSFDYL